MKRKFYILSAFAIIALGGIFAGCSNCETCGYAEVVPGEIYLTSKSANTSIGCIYSLNSDGQNVRIVSENASLISAPSGAGYLLMRTAEDRIRVYDIMNEGFLPDAFFPDSVSYSYASGTGCISSDGKFCILADADGGSIVKVDLWTGETLLMIKNSSLVASPVLSPNAEKAIFVSAANKICVYDVKADLINEFTLPESAENYVFDAVTCDDEYAYIPYKFEDKYRIFRLDIDDGSVIFLNPESCSGMPAIVAGKNELIYSDANGDLHKAVFSTAADSLPATDEIFYGVNPDEKCCLYGYSSAKNSIVFTVQKAESQADVGSFFVYNFNTGKSVYLFSNVVSGYWY